MTRCAAFDGDLDLKGNCSLWMPLNGFGWKGLGVTRTGVGFLWNLGNFVGCLIDFIEVNAGTFCGL